MVETWVVEPDRRGSLGKSAGLTLLSKDKGITSHTLKSISMVASSVGGSQERVPLWLGTRGLERMCSFIFTWKEGFPFKDGKGGIWGRSSSQTEGVEGVDGGN